MFTKRRLDLFAGQDKWDEDGLTGATIIGG
jgi:hypothetical protein